MVQQILYNAWAQPSELAAVPGLRAMATITVQRDGSVTRWTLSRPTGNRQMDDSIKDALARVTKLPVLPRDFTAPRDITVDFELTNTLRPLL